MLSAGLLFLALIIILIGAETFTNGLEHLGERMKISEGVTGSVFAAVGTALPEAMVPIVAILTSVGTQEVREEVGVGAILGAPMMLSTLTLVLMAYFASRKRGWSGHLRPERTGLDRDLFYFLIAYGIAAVAIFVPQQYTLVRGVLGITLVMLYLLYLAVTIRASAKLVEEGHGTEADHPMYLSRVGLPENMATIIVQLGLGFGFIIFGARLFVHGIEDLSALLGVSALVLSLLIIPVATELPEKVNSILWIRRGRDTLAFGNITGAMVFQGSLLPALGILLTPWAPRPEVLLGMGLTLVASIYLFILVRKRVPLRPAHLLFNGACYLAYFLILVI